MRTSPVVQSDATPYQEEQDNILRNYRIIDVGTILNVSKDNRTCTIQSFNVQNGVVQTFKDVEILYPGSITLGIIGCPCLIFRPATGVDKIRDNTLISTYKMHPEESVKAIPLFFDQSNTKLGFVDGNFTITTDFYTISFSETGINVSLGCGAFISGNTEGLSISVSSCNVSVNSEGHIESLYRNSEDELIARTTYNPEDGSFTYYCSPKDTPSDDELDDLDTFTKWTWIKKISADGTVSLQQKDDSENILNELSIDTEGVVTISNDKRTISIDKDGNISIEAGGDISVKADGDVSVEAQNVTVEASSKAVVKGTNVELDGMTKATGTSFECGGTVAPTGNGALCGLPSCLFTGAPHVGNKAIGV